MARPPATSGGRPHRVSTALSDEELADLNDLRGTLKPGVYLRWLIGEAKRLGLKFTP